METLHKYTCSKLAFVSISPSKPSHKNSINLNSSEAFIQKKRVIVLCVVSLRILPEKKSLRSMSRNFLRAVQGMREQNSRGTITGIKPSPAGTMPESDGNQRTLRWVPGGRESMKKMAMTDQERRRRKAEKAENVLHLIFWGPK